MKKALGLCFLLMLVCASGSYAFLDFVFSDDSKSGQEISLEKKKIYLPSEDKIYRDERGRYFYSKDIVLRDDTARGGTGGSGGFFIKATGLNDQQMKVINSQFAADGLKGITNNDLVMIGGGGYWHASRNFYFGGSGCGGFIPGALGSDDMHLGIGYGGIDFLMLFPVGSSDLNLFAGALLGAGGFGIRSKNNEYSKTFWIAEPKAGLQINFSEIFAMRLIMSYLYSVDIAGKQEGTLVSQDFDSAFSLRTMTYSIGFEWGNF